MYGVVRMLRSRGIALACFIMASLLGRQAFAEIDAKGKTPDVRVGHTFDEPTTLDNWKVEATGEAQKRMPTPRVEDRKLYLLESWWNSTGTAAGPTPTDRLTQAIELEWALVMNTGTEGMGFAWVSVDKYGREPSIPPPLSAEDAPEPGGNPNVVEYDWGWEAPSLLQAFGVGFDASNPPNRDPFRGSGNVYDRPQHEVSLHWDGMEIVKRTTTVDFRDETPHRVRLRIVFVTGGADVSVTVDDESLYDSYFIPAMTAYVGRPVFGARNKDTAGDVLIDDLNITCQGEMTAPEKPTTIVALNHVLNDVEHPKNAADVVFPDDTSRFGRIVCTLRLDKPETRFDPWDRTAHIWLEDGSEGKDAKRFELLRYITPYHRGHEWRVDVTDFRPLLVGKKRIVQACGTQGEGWVVSVTFDFYPGPPADGRFATQVINLWSGNPEVGHPDKPVSDFYKRQTVALPNDAKAAKVRVVVTGHGMSPNSENAAEFMPIERTLTVNGRTYRNKLWKTDNYLNPCRPQGGTWKYDRAGWAPGDVVRPWEVVIASESRELTIDYALDPYVNENRGKTWAPTHLTEAQLIIYR